MLQLSVQQKIGVGVLIITTSFAIGRYSVSQPTVKTQEQVKTNSVDSKNVIVKQHEVIVTVKSPTGEIKTTDTIDTGTDVKDSDTTTQSVQVSQTITPQQTGTLNVYLVGAYNLTSPLTPPLAGIGVSTKLIGPVTVGVQGLFGASNLIGVTAGLTF